MVAWGDPFHLPPWEWDRLLMREVGALVVVCRQIVIERSKQD